MRKNKLIMLSFLIPIILFTGSCQKEQLVVPSQTISTSSYINNEEVAQPDLTTDANLVDTEFKVVGYVFAWTGNLQEIQYEKLTHINYAFILPTKTGGILPIDNLPKLIELVQLAHAKRVKVLISIGGWNYGDDSAFRSIAGNAGYRKTFTATLLALIKKYKLDGVDIDWETPKPGTDDNNFSLLMSQLSLTMRANSKLLSAAVPPLNVTGVQNNVFATVDYLNIMAYDSFNDLNSHSPYTLSTQALNYWIGRGLPANKAVLGVPFYGRARKDWNFLSYEMYDEILAKGGKANADSFGETHYNGISTMKLKTKLAMSKGGGIMIWELSGDVAGANSLLTAINKTVVAE